MPDASPSWRSTFIQALVVLLVLALAWLKAVSTETIAGALMMVVTAIFMGQREARTLAAVQQAQAAGASNPRMAAVRAPGPNERVAVEVSETREPAPHRGRTPTNPGTRYPGGGGGGYGGGSGDLGGDPRRIGWGPEAVWPGANRRDAYGFALVLIAVFFATCLVATHARAALAPLLGP